MSMIQLPQALIEHVKLGTGILLLGAGATKGARHPQGQSPPDARQLADMIADKFLGQAFRGRPLDQVAALAMSESDLTSVQEYIKDIFNPFLPADFHKLIPQFRWSALATTNYDLIIERAYEQPGALQTLERIS